MTIERRRHPDRRTPLGACITCWHQRGDHRDGLYTCLAPGCTCEAFTEHAQQPKARKGVARRAPVRKKAKHR